MFHSSDPANPSDPPNPPNLPNPHDSLFRTTFSQVQYAADEFRHVLPPALVARLDFRTLTLRPGSFIDQALRERFTDLLYSVALDGRKAFLYLLIEHQSTVEHLMAFRLKRYVGDIWSWYLKDHPQARRLPAVLPTVLYHSGGSGTGWTAPTNVRDLVDLEEEMRLGLGELVPSLGYVLDDLSVQEDRELLGRVMHAVPKLVLWALKHARKEGEGLLETLRDWRHVVLEVLRSPTGVEALGSIMRYILQVTKIEPERLRTAFIAQVDRQTEEAFMTGAEILMQQGREQNQRDTLLILLQERFGEVPNAVLERVRSAKPEQLITWTRRIISAQSLDELFAQP